MHLLYSLVFLTMHCLLSSSVNPPAGGQYISLARLSFAQLLRQSVFSSAKPLPVKRHMIRNNRVMNNFRTMISFSNSQSKQITNPAITANEYTTNLI